MSSKQNKPLTIGLCSEPGTGKTQYVYQFLSDVLALNAQSGANNELDGDAKQYYQKLSAEIEKGALSPTRDEKSFTVSLPEKTETSQDVNLKQYNFYDESGDSFVNYVEDDEKSDDIFNQLINNSDVLIYTINPASPEFVSETYFQTLQEHIHQLLKTIAKKRGNRYLPVYFLFTHQNDLDAASEDDKAVVQKQMDSLMAFVKQEYQNRYNRTFPRELASPKTAFGAFDLKRMGDPRWFITLIGALVSLIFGLIVLVNPFGTLMTLMRVMGAFLVVESVQDAVYAARYEKIRKSFTIH